MGKFNAVMRGKKYRREVELDGQKFFVRPLSALESGECLETAARAAKKAGVDDPKDGNPIYDLHYMVALVFRASEDESTEPFFASEEQILQHLDADRLAYVHEYVELVRDDASVQKIAMTTEELEALATLLGGSDAGAPFYFRLRPLARLSFTHFLARQWLISQGGNS